MWSCAKHKYVKTWSHFFTFIFTMSPSIGQLSDTLPFQTSRGKFIVNISRITNFLSYKDVFYLTLTFQSVLKFLCCTVLWFFICVCILLISLFIFDTYCPISSFLYVWLVGLLVCSVFCAFAFISLRSELIFIPHFIILWVLVYLPLC